MNYKKIKERNKKYLIIIIFISIISNIIIGCKSNSLIKEYIKKHPNISTERIIALEKKTIINNMTMEEVKLVLGKPQFIEKYGKNKIRWIYRNIKEGIEPNKAYISPSAFPQGIGIVVPLDYQCKEMRIDFDEKGIVFRIERIINY